MYCVRKASANDLAELSIIEREAFTESWPPTPFRRDLASKNVEILVVSINVHPGLVPEDSEANDITYENLGYMHRFLKQLNNLWSDKPVHDNKNIVIYIYDDGSVEKKYILE